MIDSFLNQSEKSLADAELSKTRNNCWLSIQNLCSESWAFVLSRIFIFLLLSTWLDHHPVDQNFHKLWRCTRHSHKHAQNWSNWKSMYVFTAVAIVHFTARQDHFRLRSITISIFWQIDYMLLCVSVQTKGCGIHASYVYGPKLFRRSGAEFGEYQSFCGILPLVFEGYRNFCTWLAKKGTREL